MTDETPRAWKCPKDGRAMAQMGRRGVWRCPACGAIFLEMPGMGGRVRRPPVWARIVMDVLGSLLVVAAVRRLRRRTSRKSASEGTPLRR